VLFVLELPSEYTEGDHNFNASGVAQEDSNDGLDSQPAAAGDGIKPGVKRSETPGSSTPKLAESAKRPIVVRLQMSVE
jgi:hypothetical protein